MKNWFLKILKLLNPHPPVGGLEVSESALHFILIKGNAIKSVSLRLPPGVIEAGKVKNPEAFKAALVELHSKITPRKKEKIYVIVNIPEGNIYLQVFNLPLIAADNLEEAVQLNLQMISPLDYQTVYSDWQKVGEVDVDGGQLEILGAFVPRRVVDDFTKQLIEAHFVVTAIEMPGMALSRLINPEAIANQLQSVVLFRLSSGGLSFSILRNGNLYFNHFVPWQAGQISWAALQDMVIRETQKVLNFYTGHWPGALAGFLLVAPTPEIEEKLSRLIADTFTLQVFPLKNFLDRAVQKLNLASIGLESLVALGSAVRGLIPRAKDTIISPAAVGTEEDYRRNRILNFINVWRNASWTVALFIFAIFLATDLFLIQTTKSLEARLANIKFLSESQERNELVSKAKEFNQKIDLALEAQKQRTDWTPFLQKINDLAGTKIILKRVFVQSLNTPVQLNAQAPSEDEILDFKNALSSDSQFQDVNLPLGSIVPASGGMKDFSISFKLKNL